MEDRLVEITAAEQNKEKGTKRKEDSLRDLQNNIKHTNIPTVGVPEVEEREGGTENICEDIIPENFPNLRKETGIQVLSFLGKKP